MIIVMKKPKQQCVFSDWGDSNSQTWDDRDLWAPGDSNTKSFQNPQLYRKIVGMCPIIGATIDSMDMLECSSTFWQWNIAARIAHGNIYCNSIKCHGPYRLQEALSDFLDNPKCDAIISLSIRNHELDHFGRYTGQFHTKVPGVLINPPHRNGRKIRLVSSCLSANSEATKEAKLVALATLLGVAVSSLVESWFSVLRGWWQPPARWPWGLNFPEMMGNSDCRTSPSSYWKHDYHDFKPKNISDNFEK